MGAAISLYLHMKTNAENMRQRKEKRDTEEDINKTTLNCYFESNLSTHTHTHSQTNKHGHKNVKCVSMSVCVCVCECASVPSHSKSRILATAIWLTLSLLLRNLYTHTKGFNQYGCPPTSRHPFLLFISFSASKPSSRSIIWREALGPRSQLSSM